MGFILAVLLYWIATALFIKHLERHHPKVWISIGRPKLIHQSIGESMESMPQLIKYIYTFKYLREQDALLSFKGLLIIVSTVLLALSVVV